MKNVDLLLAKKYAKWKHEQAKKESNEPIPQAQVALGALDPRTGEIKAVIGGRRYAERHQNHALAHRQPRSPVKPFVYFPALDHAVVGLLPVTTPPTTHDRLR